MLRMSVRRNLQLGLWLSGVPWRQPDERARQALARVELVDLADRNGRALSGGQQQRVALARAWALRPDVWLLDEPTASLDPHAKREVEALIADFTTAAPAPGRRAPTLVFSSHNLGQVKRLASRVVYLERGRVLADLPVNDFFNPDRLEAQSPQANLFVKGETT
jgi:tungstate transport system ATP-binding protein